MPFWNSAAACGSSCESAAKPAIAHVSTKGNRYNAMPHFGRRDTGVRRKHSSSTKPSSA